MFRGRLQAALAATAPGVVLKDMGATWTTEFTGYVLSFTSNDPRLTIAGICGAESERKALTLKVPTGQPPIAHPSDDSITYSELTSANMTLNMSGDTCNSPMDAAAGLYFRVESYDGRTLTSFNWDGGDGFSGKIPEGYWDVTLGSELIGRFDLAAAYPMNAATPPRPIVYIPGLKLTIDPTTRAFVSADIKLFRWSATQSAFVEESDLAAFTRAATDVTLTSEDYSTAGASWSGKWAKTDGATIALPETGAALRVAAEDLDKTWIVPAEDDTGSDDDHATPSASAISINYSMYGVGYRFDFSWHAP